MAGSDDATLSRITNVMRETFGVPTGTVISRATSSFDVDGWDSLSHSLFILGVEEEFGMDLPLDKTYEMKNVGDLVDLIESQTARKLTGE
jgi:acyl carrier protein